MRCCVLVVDDHALLRAGLRSVLSDDEYEITAEVSSARQAMQFVDNEAIRIDIAIVDYGLPDRNGVELTRELVDRRPELRVIVLSAYDDADIVHAAIRAGARAFVKKTETAQTLLDALETIRGGGSYLSAAASDRIMERIKVSADDDAIRRRIHKLSPRELQVLRMIASGKTTKEIACALALATSTAKAHRKSVMRKLGATNTAQLMTIAAKQRIITLSEWRD